VKDITGQLYGDEKTNDIQFVRKIQTILKKMEKSNIVRILPKKTPWELQRYALISFRFQDSDKNLVVLATDQQIQETQKLLQSASNQQQTYATELGKAKILLVAFMVIASYVLIVWDVAQAVVNPFVFVIAFALAVIGSLVLGKLLSRK
jgi:Flp pilus assembly protein TadB